MTYFKLNMDQKMLRFQKKTLTSLKTGNFLVRKHPEIFRDLIVNKFDSN